MAHITGCVRLLRKVLTLKQVVCPLKLPHRVAINRISISKPDIFLKHSMLRPLIRLIVVAFNCHRFKCLLKLHLSQNSKLNNKARMAC